MRAILTYHSIDPSGSPISIDAGTFRRHVDFLASGRVRVVALSEIAAVPAEEDALAITFDDGYTNFAQLAWPLLAEHGLPATLFVVTARVGDDNQWPDAPAGAVPTLPLCDWDTLGALAEDGVELGAHSRTHPHLARLDAAARADEIAGSADDLEARTGRRPASFCYPYGDLDEATVAATGERFARACTTELAVLDPQPDPLRLPRLDAFYYRSPGNLERFGGARFRAHLSLRGALRGVRRRWSRMIPPSG